MEFQEIKEELVENEIHIGSQLSTSTDIGGLKNEPEYKSEVKAEIKKEFADGDQGCNIEGQLTTSLDLKDLKNEQDEDNSEFPQEQNTLGILNTIYVPSNYKKQYTSRRAQGNNLKLDICVKLVDRTKYLNHGKDHTGKQLHKCEMYFKQFSQLSRIKQHMEAHTGEILQHSAEKCREMDVHEALDGLFEAVPMPRNAPKPSQSPPRNQQSSNQGHAKRTSETPLFQRSKRSRGKGKGKSQNQIGKPGFDKKPNPAERMMYKRRSHFLVFCSNVGVDMLCKVVFTSMQFRGFRTAGIVSLAQFKYVVCLALWARIASVAVAKGYITHDVPEVTMLLRSVVGLRLPPVLARYIETLGTFTLANGCTIAHWFASREEMQNQYQIDYDIYLHEAIPIRPVPANYWSIDRDWIALWNQATTQPACLSMHFRPIKLSQTEGSVEMIVTPIVCEEQLLQPTAPQQLTDLEGQLGSVYTWRNFAYVQHWPAQTQLVCTRFMFGNVFNAREFWSEHVVGSLVSE